ncbi:superinfection immunity protein [Deltaproteobacteria bacterium TL4]
MFGIGFYEIFIGLPLYFLPTILGRKNKNFKGLFLVNLLLGWTLLGWGVALVWSLKKGDLLTQEAQEMSELEQLKNEVNQLLK